MGLTQITTGGVDKNINIDSNTLKVDGTNNRIGINTATPQTVLDVEGSGAVARIKAPDQSNARVRIQAGNSSRSFLEFGDSDDTDVGEIVYDHGGNYMRFNTAATERMRIDSSGDVLFFGNIRKDNASSSLTVSGGNGASSGANIVLAGQSGSPANSVRFRYGSNESMRIDSSGRVGIGTTTPGSYSSSADELVVAGTTNPGITIAGSSGNTGTIMFADGTSGSEVYRGQIDYQHASDAMVFFTNGGSERMRIDSSGNIGVGGTPTVFTGQNFISVHSPGSSTNIAGLDFYVSGTRESGLISYPSNSESLRIFGNTARAITLHNNGAERMRIDASGSIGVGGIAPSKGSFFGGTQNVLHIAGSTCPEIRLQSSTSGQGDLCVFASNSAKKSRIYSRATNGAITFDVTDSSGNLIQDALQVIGRGIARGSASQGFAPSNGSAMFTGYHSGSFRLGFDCFNLPGNAWFTQSLLFFFGSVKGTLSGNTHGMAHIRLTGLSSWGLNSTSVIQGGSITVASANTSSNHIDLDFTFSSGSRGPVSFWVQSPNNAIPKITFTG